MTFEPTLIAPFKSGLVTNTEPWLSPADSFRLAENFHVHHGYLEKRSGYRLWGDLGEGLRVMGIVYYIEDDGSKTNLAFDTEFGYLYNTLTEVYDKLDAGVQTLDGGEYDYVASVNWQSSGIPNRLYYTNGLPYDGAFNGIRYYPGATPADTALLTPAIDSVVTLYGAKLLFTIGERLVALYTYENDGVTTSAHPQRARWCAKQSPSNWDRDSAAGADSVDAATGDQILSAQALKNQIIVFFTNSVWLLQPTADPHKAFRWSRLNNFRACDGKMASASYDRFAIALGVRGIHATDATETRRADEKIPDFTIDEINFLQFQKVFCFRNYENERWWSLYASGESDENDSALIYDDDSQAFTTYKISLNCLGYGNSTLDYRLSDFSVANNLDYSLDDMSEETLWSFYFDDKTDVFLGGNITGQIYQLDFGTQDVNEDVEAQFITASWNPFQTEGKESQLSYVDFYVDTDKETVGTVYFYKNDEVDPYVQQGVTFLPNLNYLTSITQISQTNPCLVNAPQHGLSTGDTVYIYGVLGMTEIGSAGAYTVTVVNGNSFTLDGIDATGFSAYTGGGKVYQKEFYQTRTWVRVYGGGIGYLHWIKVQIAGGDRPCRFHAIKPAFRGRGRRTIN